MNRTLDLTKKLILIVWASPSTSVGVLVGTITLVSGGRAQIRQGALEFYGGWLPWIMTRLPVRAAAMTLGHIIVGQTPEFLDDCRAHEQAHVRQAERWGPAFIPAYLLASLWVWTRGRHFYLDNPFEIDARHQAGDGF